ncbi:MAG: putative RecB family exonuclease [Frankiaceae bacterium]|nr:putative RecB family exonuclease [Frankiaceae bacterium]
MTEAPLPALEVTDWSLSPSRALDFKTCALLYRFRVIDRLPEPPGLDAARGTVVHGILEKLFDLPGPARTVAAAAELVDAEWRELIESDPELGGLVDASPDGLAALAESTRELLTSYFALEDPRRIEPAEREVLVETVLPSGVRLKGFVDRLDRSADGRLRVVDYKTGKSPREEFEGKALFQLRFYALVLWRSTGVLPTMLRLYYLANRECLDYLPDERDLIGLERQVEALGRAIAKARETGDWRHKPSKLCDWCAFQALCPAFGGTPPPLPVTPPG